MNPVTKVDVQVLQTFWTWINLPNTHVVCSIIRTSTLLENTWASFWRRNCASPKWLLLSRLHHHSCPWKTFSSILCNIMSSKVIIQERYIDDAAESYWIRFETFNQLYTITFNLCKKVSSFFNEFVTIRKLWIQKYYKTEYLIWSLAILQILDVTGQIKFWRQTLLYGNQTKIVFLELLLYNFTWTQTQPTKNFDVKRLWTELNDLRCQGRSYCGEVRKNCVLHSHFHHFYGRLSSLLWTGRSDLLGTTEVERTVQARATHRLNPP